MNPTQSVERDWAPVPPRVLLVDDEPTFLESTAALLSERGHPCDQACDGETALRMFDAERHDVVVTDLVMNERVQLDFVATLCHIESRPTVILITAFPTLESAIRALELRVFAYLVKPFGIDELAQRLESARVRSHLPDIIDGAREKLQLAMDELAVAGRLSSDWTRGAVTALPGGAPNLPRILSGNSSVTRREQEILGELTKGYRVSTIARRLNISPHTVRRHLKSIFLKLDVNSQAELLEKLRPWTE